ncbi:membrane protein [Psychrosphaera saromensis]|uniref:Uncharacterized protein n=1 Tax=Psychrosphaera saromensis TaxID=716813 RepID=A0A2S7UR06_9GAMM|nr:YeeE/YedE family protein [Psychrosphaera saromensis]PQJ52406.1 hypothetical protein BTO11_01225 [Psychrosphaera saromensis]GHB73508.1 membrane protein [Psychrosphaera saromensis]GLQ13425.1 membrane protein [Psychrosphaera saromensis]
MVELTSSDFFLAALGGSLIGISAILMLYFIGRIAGICGITFSLLDSNEINKPWRWVFLLGLILGPMLVHQIYQLPIPDAPTDNIPLLILAGLITGFGTKLSNGCTSGHGVCGIARFSSRSIVATITFMLFGFISVYALKHLIGL